MSNSKKFYTKAILTFGGIFIIFISIICMIISSIIIDDKELSGIMISGFIGLGIIGFIMFIIAGNFNMLFSLYRNHGVKISLMYDYKKVGVPNNKYEEFKVSYNEICSKDIYLEEVFKSIYQGVINNRIVVFNMKGWHNQSYYIYEYFLSILQVELSKNDKKKMYKKLNCNIPNLSLIIKKNNGKIIKHSLVSNGLTMLSFKFKERVKIKISNIFTDKINICSFYEFEE